MLKRKFADQYAAGSTQRNKDHHQVHCSLPSRTAVYVQRIQQIADWDRGQ